MVLHYRVLCDGTENSMSGLDKIVEQIQINAANEAENIKNSAAEYCNAYMDDVKEKVTSEVEAYNKKALEERNLYIDKTHSGAEFRERNLLLKTKQQCVEHVINAAKDTIANMPEKEYFEFIEKILVSNIQAQKGVMYFGKKDMERLPKDFEEKVKKAAKAKDGELVIAQKPADIKDGFILVYGEIEENCTLKALFDTNIDRLKDIVSKELFS